MSGEGCYRFLLRLLLPARVREEGEEEIVGLFREERARARERGTSGTGFWIRMVADALLMGVLERLPGRSQGRERRAGQDHGHRGDGEVGMEQLLKDIRLAVRQLVRRPGFALVLIVTLALGIGANTAVFSVVNAVLLRPLAYDEPERLVAVWTQFPSMELLEFPASAPEYIDYRTQSRSFEQLAGFVSQARTITGDGEPERVQVAFATWQLFPTLGLEPALGRVFSEAEDVAGADGVVVLSWGLWQTRFGGDPGVVGRSVLLDGTPLTVVGVMPAEFRFPDAETRAWIPLGLDPANPGGRSSHYLSMVGRLAPGVTPEAAAVELRSLSETWAADPTLDHTWSPDFHPAFVRSLREQTVGDVSRTLWVMMGAVLVVLLIACANVANLLLVRGEGRIKEISVRTALGAGRLRIVSQLLTESLIMALTGGTAGLALAWVGVRALRAVAPPDLPRLDEIGVDPQVLLFSLAVTVGAGIFFGLIPALQAGRTDVQASLREEGRGGSVGLGRMRMRQLLVVSETALAVMLLVAAGLLLQSFRRLQAVDPGFRAEQVLSLSLNVPAASYPDTADVTAFYEGLVPRMAALPGVTSAGAVRTAPLAGALPPNDVEVDGYLMPDRDAPPLNVDAQMVTPGYFEAMGIRLLEGRVFDGRDGADAPLVAVVSEQLAERYWSGRSALGGRIRQSGFPEWTEVVGVVADVHQEGLDQEARPTLYFVHPQGGRTWFPVRAMTLVLRTAVEPTSLVGAVRREVQAVDPDIALYQVETLSQAVADSTATERFSMLLQLVFALVALTLAAVGIYGVMAFSVARRTGEIGIRMALGADRGQVLRMVVGQGMTIVLVAVLLGVGGALATAQVLSSLLYGISPRDPVTYAAVVGTLVAIAFLACWLPARRASGVDPGSALRYE